VLDAVELPGPMELAAELLAHVEHAATGAVRDVERADLS